MVFLSEVKLGQEYFINSERLEAKVRDLLPSQGGAGAGFDLSASTQIVPVINLTESAEGSNLREDLQTAWDFATGHITLSNASSTIISTTGFWKIGFNFTTGGTVSSNEAKIRIFDGSSYATIWRSDTAGTSGAQPSNQTGVFIAYIRAGDTVIADTNASDLHLNVWYRQIAGIDGTLTNPSGFS